LVLSLHFLNASKADIDLHAAVGTLGCSILIFLSALVKILVFALMRTAISIDQIPVIAL
jgi:hypothetical protein